MRARKSGNQFTCLNCGYIVDWTDFQCPICGLDPRQKERAGEVAMAYPDSHGETVERRKYPRYQVQGKVILNRFFRGELIDLCQNGARVKTVLHVFRDEIVRLDFTVKGIPIQVRARVVHVKKGVLDERFTLGVCFEAIANDQSRLLDHHLKAISEEKPSPRYLA
ncbi:MAG: PilZ domain-containing protein [Deltaproteobacteria bacterium]|nr:PilZ domain-containing protein [Deltaproteobacteria bacterium]MBW2120434.1 PilZ domain-containing protein [Deltaproteobacteria bacterium]